MIFSKKNPNLIWLIPILIIVTVWFVAPKSPQNRLVPSSIAGFWESVLPEDQYNLGNLYASDKQNDLALKYYLKAANQGYALAQHRAAYFYEKGIGTEQDVKTALSLYEKAANQGLVKSMRNLAILYSQGTLVPLDDEKSFYWTLKAAEEGDALAMKTVAFYYKSGQKTQKDMELAIQWFEKAIEAGDVDSINLLAGIYHDDEGGSRTDHKKAKILYEKAALQNHPAAIYNLALMYHYGRGITKDYLEAGALYKKSSDLGLSQAKEAIDYFTNFCLEGKRNFNTDEDLLIEACLIAAGSGNEIAERFVGIYYYIASEFERSEGISKIVKKWESRFNDVESEPFKEVYEVLKSRIKQKNESKIEDK